MELLSQISICLLHPEFAQSLNEIIIGDLAPRHLGPQEPSHFSSPVAIHAQYPITAQLGTHGTFVPIYGTFVPIYGTQRTALGAFLLRRRAWLNIIFFGREPDRSISSGSSACPKKRLMTSLRAFGGQELAAGPSARLKGAGAMLSMKPYACVRRAAKSPASRPSLDVCGSASAAIGSSR